MLLPIVEIIAVLLTGYLFVAGVYQAALAGAYFLVRRPRLSEGRKSSRFAILVPAHDEEILIDAECRNLVGIDYPAELRDIFIIADNCNDKTEEICAEYPVTVLSRRDTTKCGKGYALEWALDRIDLKEYDAVLVVDADTAVRRDILTELNRLLNDGEQAIQCYIEVPNRAESWFTQLIHLSRTINDLLYHDAKYKLGLSSYLMGSGMCFRADLLKKKRWTAFTLSEDWEYYAQLIEDRYKIAFASDAVVYQQESSSLKQATTQRLRWASGRFYVVKNLGVRLFFKGLRRRDPVMVDASMALLLPNWSLQINLLIVALGVSLLLQPSLIKSAVLSVVAALLALQAMIVATGVLLSGCTWDTLRAILVAPLFLAWKFIIDVLCITGLYRGKKWIRTERHMPSTR